MRTPASERAVRCAQLRNARIVDAMRIAGISFAFGLAGFFGLFIFQTALHDRQIKRLVPAGFTPPDSGFDQLIPVWMVMGGTVVFVSLLSWVLPIVVRKDRKFAARVSKESLSAERKKRAFMYCIKRKRGWILGACCIGLLVVVSLAAKDDRNMVLHMSAIAGWFAGISLIGLGIFGRSGRHLVCACCDHEMRSWRSAGTRCSECGCVWKEPWNAEFGAKRVRWIWVGWGAACVAASVGYLAWAELTRA